MLTGTALSGNVQTYFIRDAVRFLGIVVGRESGDDPCFADSRDVLSIRLGGEHGVDVVGEEPVVDLWGAGGGGRSERGGQREGVMKGSAF